MSHGKLTLNRYNGTEIFTICDATIYLLDDDGETELNFEIETDGAIQVLPENEEGNIQPSMEIAVAAPEHNWDTFAGSQYRIDKGDTGEDFVARLYYHEHQPIDDVTVRILEKEDDKYRVSINGKTCDPRYYDDSKPRTDIQVDAWFSLND